MILPTFPKKCKKLRTFWAVGGLHRGAFPCVRHCNERDAKHFFGIFSLDVNGPLNVILKTTNEMKILFYIQNKNAFQWDAFRPL